MVTATAAPRSSPASGGGTGGPERPRSRAASAPSLFAPARRMRLELADRLFGHGGAELAAQVDERVAQAQHGPEPEREAHKAIPVDLDAQDGERVGEPEDVRRHARPGACKADAKELIRRGERARLRPAERDLDRLQLG